MTTLVKIDLITGFLGSGKTTFIKKYADYLVRQGQNIGILENDYGAVNVDMMLLQDVMGENCHAEMVAGGCGEDCHKRRFKTKLIAMAMSGYDRVIVEPSGIFDIDEFFDVLHEEPLDRWYEVGNIITIVEAELEKNLSRQSRYVLASEAANCGIMIMSKTDGASVEDINSTVSYVNSALEEFKCKRRFGDDVMTKSWDDLTDADFAELMRSGYKLNDFVKVWFKQSDVYNSVYIMNKNVPENELEGIVRDIFADAKCGEVFRIKGFSRTDENTWIEINATRQKTEIRPIENGQDIIIVIGSDLHEANILKYFD